ncbi:MAG TPA: hypothetical protein VFB78_12745 [Acidimicrobiales bacterium]|nr:hypothetical protein [Acidimicrobiales bacterium]
MRRRAVGLLLVLTAIALTTTACRRERDQKLDVRAAIDRTERVAHRFAYIDTVGRIKTQVAGVVEDDFRYKARLTVNGLPVEDEVVSDDALAVRFLEPGALPGFLNVDNATAASAAAGRSAPQVALAGLSTKRWVLDPVGAPQLAALATEKRVPGEDPVFDALTALQYIRDAADRGDYIRKYSKDAIDPVYRSTEDPFPPPPEGQIRYDVKPPRLPRSNAGPSNQATPETANFRKLVIYVKDGLVVEAREQIDVASKLDDLISEFKLPHTTTVEQAVAAINAVRRGQGNDTIRVRKLVLRIQGIGTTQKVELPAESVNGDLRVLKHRGRQGAPGARQPSA